MDESEASNTQKLLDEIFGEINFVGTIVSKSNPQGRGKKYRPFSRISFCVC